MGLVILWFVHTTFALALLATALVAARGIANRTVRRIVVALAFFPLAIVHALVAVKMALLRFDQGVEHAPWIWASAILLAHVAGALVVRVRVRESRWPLARCALVLVAAFAADQTAFHVRRVDGRFLGMSMQLDAGRIAYRLTPPRPTEGLNAAPLYEALGPELAAIAADERTTSWLGALRTGTTLDTTSPALRAELARMSSTLERLRTATRLPHCVFVSTDEVDFVASPLVTPFLHASDILRLAARVRTADGDLVGAVSDVGSMFALGRHLAERPSVLTLLMATVVRSRAVDELVNVLSAPQLTSRDLESLVVPDTALSAELERALRMEEALLLSGVGRALASDVVNITPPNDSLTWMNNQLFFAFAARADVTALRLGFEDLRRSVAAEVAPSREELARYGVLAGHALTRLTGHAAQLRAGDARLALGRAAAAAARWKLEHGEYPRTLGPWCGADAPLRVEGDGTSIVLTHMGTFPEPVVLRLPASPR